MRKNPLLFAALGLAALLALGALSDVDAAENPSIQITQLRADLEMKDFHDVAQLQGPLAVGVPITLTFKNDAVVKVTPLKIENNVITLSTELERRGGATLYNATFYTHYNVDTDISEKTPSGDLVYRLKINPEIQSSAQ